jgi:C-terminal processing protease CtpA/Prc
MLITIAFSAVAALAADSYDLLRDTRSKLTLDEYSVEEKRVVVDQAKLVLEQLFVHEAVKLAHFGEAANVRPHLNRIEETVDTLPTADLHREMQKIFRRVRDWHTLYVMPKPFACHRSFLPFDLAKIGNDLVVSQLVKKPEVASLVDLASIDIGDVLLSYDGISTEEALKQSRLSVSAANFEAAEHDAIENLTYVSHKYDLLPSMDSVVLEFRKQAGHTYKVELPWISKGIEDCLLNRKPDTSSLTKEPILASRLIENTHGKFGYLKLSSFSPEFLSLDATVLEIKRILEEDFTKTDGLIIDLRNNGGGKISLAHKLVELFSPKAPTPLNFVLKTSEGNKHFVEHMYKGSETGKALEEAIASGALYSRPFTLDPKETISTLGQSYFKPVALMTNAKCYSSCDMFAALMQDNGLGRSFGEDSTTGGGGANNYDHSFFVDSLKDNMGPLKKMPHGQDFRFAWRQTLRVLENAGRLIEDEGVRANVILKKSLNDLLHDSQDEINTVTEWLKNENPKFTSSVVMSDTKDYAPEALFTIDANWTGTTSILLKNRWGTTARADVPESGSGEVVFPGLTLGPKLIKRKFEVVGMNGDAQVWRRVISTRVAPGHRPWQGTPGELLPITVFEDGGWKGNAPGEYVIKDYKPDMDSDLSMFVELPSTPLEFSFSSELNIEENFDYVKVQVVHGKSIETLKSLTGKLENKGYSFNLSRYQGKKVEIRLKFTSDRALELDGVSVRDLLLKRSSTSTQ